MTEKWPGNWMAGDLAPKADESKMVLAKGGVLWLVGGGSDDEWIKLEDRPVHLENQR